MQPDYSQVSHSYCYLKIGLHYVCYPAYLSVFPELVICTKPLLATILQGFQSDIETNFVAVFETVGYGLCFVENLNFNTINSMLFNTFENVAYDFFPKLEVYKGHFLKLGAPFVHLAGSGPTLFTMLEDKAKAEDIYRRCRDQKMECYLAATLSSLDGL